ncbi:23S rRNA (uracil(747)-C(5))-methyltransferase RlmC [Gilliamella sp. B2865]|uniref:23S rRNA (uracil(747)-C(5))-methyltransferase RlmC n=1 Tax=unclassified Gilliamella TaxID=2685620 RepID=UPI00226AFD83|nr:MULTISPECIES: 23S rRNA (uracil(747)-C(5))-methyltransferase RlmC [unclassified Gilliamella]MCX8585319.1 23S rRNA (uracil(747)-C(5))-methyltransferase RlmC [Gilliamella sp. B3562]MCX8669674.1 23S rRNA (uracil(747)-C(5))-methyltransferase RlmC [Gilliamella sp. B2785]MCX8678399.1 23S rRNA (uracil(747)-C(5))-methyltransferase RlmC [Gilliamella sp. B2865]MCX8685015.1 23S rRNA (uracil(747)-C(5))-methyltransferase RlmC [Gilliamella sp. B2864]
MMQCSYYQEKKCLSCHKINQPYHSQLTEKQSHLLEKLADFNPNQVNDPYASPESGFRNKAKMAVLGTVEKPILGIQNGNDAIDLCDCPLYSSNMQNILKLVRTYIRKQGLVPYNINKRKGELKFVIITESIIDNNSHFMLRFVLKSHKFVEKIKNSYHNLQINNLEVVTINIQPNHAAILEGEEELILTDNPFLAFQFNQIPLYIKSKSFFQTNSYIAEKLYQTASDWVANLNVNSIWDLFCGVGGFGLHCIGHSNNEKIQLTGIEISSDAIECATKSAEKLGYDKLDFKSLDATKYVNNEQGIPDLVLLNPPRRGAGKSLIQYLDNIKPKYILYSSCNLASMVEDLQLLSDYQMTKAQLFDMFPHTSHMEVLVLLEKYR